MVLQEDLKLADDFRRGVHQPAQLAQKHRHDQERQDDEDQKGKDRDDGGGGGAAQPRPLQPVGDGVEEVGDGPADEEGQDHGAQPPQHQEEDRRGDPPVDELLANGHAHAGYALLMLIRWQVRCGHASLHLRRFPAVSTCLFGGI